MRIEPYISMRIMCLVDQLGMFGGTPGDIFGDYLGMFIGSSGEGSLCEINLLNWILRVADCFYVH